MHDSQFDTPSTTNLNDEADTYNSTIEKYGNGIAEHVRAWTIDVSKLSEGDVGELNQKLEEVAWVVCILYGIGGWTGRQGGSGGQFNADFFL
jgi:Questin oxidase-like